jgi:hypothetical protein
MLGIARSLISEASPGGGARERTPFGKIIEIVLDKTTPFLNPGTPLFYTCKVTLGISQLHQEVHTWDFQGHTSLLIISRSHFSTNHFQGHTSLLIISRSHFSTNHFQDHTSLLRPVLPVICQFHKNQNDQLSSA